MTLSNKVSVHIGGDVINSNIITSLGPVIVQNTPPRILTNTLPVSINPFVGRSELIAKINDRLQHIDQTNLINLRGMGGVGKSALALHIAHLSDDIFKGGRHWLDLRQKDLATVVRNFLRSIGFANEEQLNSDYETLCRMMQSVLGETDERVLLVLDNADDLPQQSLSLLCLPHPHATIITSRTALYQNDITVDMLDDSEGLEFLDSYQIYTSEQRDYALALINRLGNLPLALEITAKRMYYENHTCHDALLQMNRSGSLLEQLQLPEVENYSLAETFAISYNKLNEIQKKTFHALGLCAVSGAPIAVVAWMSSVSSNRHKEILLHSLLTGGAIDLQQLSGITKKIFRWVKDKAIPNLLNINENITKENILTLSKFSLVNFDGARVVLHPLLRDYANKCATKHEYSWFQLLRLMHYFNIEIGEKFQQSLFSGDVQSNVMQMVDRERDNVLLTQIIANESLNTDVTINFAMYWAMRSESDLPKWLAKTEKLLKIISPKRQILTYFARAIYECNQNNTDLASEWFSKCAKLLEKNPQVSSAEVFYFWGLAQSLKDEYHLAIGTFQHALETFETSKDTLGQAKTLAMLGYTFLDCNEVDKSINSFAQSITKMVDAGLKNQPFFALCLAGIGFAAIKKEEYEAAISALEAALEIIKPLRLLTYEAVILGNLGHAQYIIGNIQNANLAYEQAIDLYQKIGIVPGKAEIYGYIGLDRQQPETLETALEFFEKAKDTRRIGAAKLILAHIYADRNEKVEALILAKEAQQSWTEIDFTDGLKLVDAFFAKLGDSVSVS